jgi:D-arabinose 1-dehydrogenase-like Zn-dependent alcohol dehydrogenase
MTYQSVNPFNNKVLKTFKELTNAEFETKLVTAATCFETWRHKTYAERAVIIAKAAALMHSKGADAVVNAKAGEPAVAVKQATGGGAHGVLITAPSLPAFKQGVGMARKRGTCVLVGLPPGEFPLPLFDVVANCITVRGSFVGTRQDMAECLAFAADGKVKADIELQPLTSINAVFERLAHGDVPSRVVLDFAAPAQNTAALGRELEAI